MSVPGLWALMCPNSAQPSWQDEGEVQLAGLFLIPSSHGPSMVTEGNLDLWQCCSDTMSPEGLSTFKTMFAQVRL